AWSDFACSELRAPACHQEVCHGSRESDQDNRSVAQGIPAGRRGGIGAGNAELARRHGIRGVLAQGQGGGRKDHRISCDTGSHIHSRIVRRSPHPEVRFFAILTAAASRPPLPPCVRPPALRKRSLMTHRIWSRDWATPAASKSLQILLNTSLRSGSIVSMASA